MNLVIELVVTLFSLSGVTDVMRRQQVTTQYVIERLVEVAQAILAIDCKDRCEKDLLMSLLGRRIADVVTPGSTVNIEQMVKELHDETHGLLDKLKECVLPLGSPEAKVEDSHVEQSPVIPGTEQNAEDSGTVDPVVTATVDTVRNTSITELGLPTRARNAFIADSLTTIGSIVDYSKAKSLEEIKGIGDEMAADTLTAIKSYAENNGVRFEDL